MAVTAFASPGTYTAAAAREAVTAGLAGTSSTTSINPRNGIFPDGVNPFAVTAYSGMTVSVKQGQAVVAGWVFTSDTAVTVTLATSGSVARTDLVILRVQDQESGDASSVATVEVVTGTSTAVPALPSIRCLVLAQIAVGATVGSITAGNITDRRVYTGAAGGIIPAPGALASAPTVPTGTAVYDSAVDQFGIANGAAWRTFLTSDYVTPWRTLTLQPGFGLPATGLSTPRLRKVNGMVEFAGSTYYAGTMPSGGALMSSAPEVTAAVVAAGAWTRIPIAGMQGGTGATYVPGFALRLLANGQIWVDPPTTITSVTVTLSGRIDDASAA